MLEVTHLISRSSYVTWRSKHSLHTTSWTQGKDLCCLTSKIHLYASVMPSQEMWEIKTTNRIGYYLPVTWSNLTVTVIFKVVAENLHKSSICVLLPGQPASIDFLVKLGMTDYAHSTYYRTWSPKDMNILQGFQWRAAKTIKVLEHLSYNERLRELELLSLENKRLRLNVHKYLMGRCKTQSQTLSGIHWKDKRQ